MLRWFHGRIVFGEKLFTYSEGSWLCRVSISTYLKRKESQSLAQIFGYLDNDMGKWHFFNLMEIFLQLEHT
jgi:hypothetical protein